MAVPVSVEIMDAKHALRNFARIRDIARNAAKQGTFAMRIVDELGAETKQTAGRRIVRQAHIAVFFVHVYHRALAQVELGDDGAGIFRRRDADNFFDRFQPSGRFHRGGE